MSLKKLCISAYSDTRFQELVDQYTLQINPESYKHQHSASYAKNDATDTAGVTTKFIVLEPQKLQFEFYLDATGVVPGVTDVAAEIKRFKAVAYSYNGTIHSANYLTVTWGKGAEGTGFQCRLTSLDIDYVLFRPDGTPLRAKLAVGFEQYLSPDALALLANKNSPDMSHLRTVAIGDKLPNLCYQIYGDSKYYLDVARHNRLDNFRRLTPGSTLSFPPLS